MNVYDDMNEASADGYDTADGSDNGHDSGVEDVETGPSHIGQQETHSDGSAADTEVDSQEARRTRRRLEHLEKEALAVMRKVSPTYRKCTLRKRNGRCRSLGRLGCLEIDNN